MQKPSRLRTRADTAIRLISVVAISFSLTFVAVSLAFLAGVLPAQFTTLGGIDTAVMLLFLPLCALAVAIVVEVIRAAATGPLRSGPVRHMPPLSAWQPGHIEDLASLR